VMVVAVVVAPAGVLVVSPIDFLLCWLTGERIEKFIDCVR